MVVVSILWTQRAKLWIDDVHGRVNNEPRREDGAGPVE